MIAIESNANEVFTDILEIFRGIPGIVGKNQLNLQTAISWGLTEQFDALSYGEVVPSDGDYIAWDAISPLTEFIRQTRWGVPPSNPILVVTGSLRRGLTDGTTYVYDYEKTAELTYLPSGDQEDRIRQHEEGFTVTSPIDAGHESPPRPMLFWSDRLADDIIAILERGIDNLAESRGFR